jgi:hypothetical protein
MEKNIHVFYLMNGQILLADYFGEEEDTGDYIIKGAVMVMIGQNKQIGMSTAYPFTHIDDKIELNCGHVTTKASMAWNKQLCGEYDKFWESLAAAQLKKETGIEVVPANATLPGQGLGVGPRLAGKSGPGPGPKLV